MPYQSMAERFSRNGDSPMADPASLAQALRSLLGIQTEPSPQRGLQGAVWSYEELGDGLPDDIPD